MGLREDLRTNVLEYFKRDIALAEEYHRVGSGPGAKASQSSASLACSIFVPLSVASVQ